MADYYQENTSNLLSSVELPFSNGFTDYVENIGELQQRGWELSARITIIRKDASRLLWSVSGNIAHNEDKIVKLSQALKAANDKLALQYDYTANIPNKIIREGESQNIIYAVRSLGIDPSTGKELFLNRFGQVTLFLECSRPCECGPFTTQVPRQFQHHAPLRGLHAERIIRIPFWWTDLQPDAHR